jgi:5-methylcytosine-specific restriction enzyme subunit McrC
LPCAFDEHTEDVWLNRVLRSAIEVALRMPFVPAIDRRILRRHLDDFELVRPWTGTIPEIDHWRPSRLETHYEPAVRCAALLLRTRSLTDRATSDGVPSMAFTVNMNALVETFIEDRLRRALAGTLELRGQQVTPFDVERRVLLRPDYVFTRDRRPVFVADCKYKDAATIEQVKSGDLMQLHTYAHLLGVPSGALIECAVGRPDPADHTIVRKSGTMLHVWPVDLSGTPEQIDEAIERVAASVRVECDESTV